MLTKRKNLLDKSAGSKKVHPIIGLVLLMIAMVLLILTGPIGFLYSMIYAFIRKGLTGLGEFCFQMALAIDQLGNVIMQHLLNHLIIKKREIPFGDPDETISSVIGKNMLKDNLTRTGRSIDKILNFIDPAHSFRSIAYQIEYRPHEKGEIHIPSKAQN